MSWAVIHPTKRHPERELVRIVDGRTVKRETTKLGPRGAYQEAERRNAAERGDVTQLHCVATGLDPGADNATHHLRPTPSGRMVCAYCKQDRAAIVAAEIERREH